MWIVRGQIHLSRNGSSRHYLATILCALCAKVSLWLWSWQHHSISTLSKEGGGGVKITVDMGFFFSPFWFRISLYPPISVAFVFLNPLPTLACATLGTNCGGGAFHLRFSRSFLWTTRVTNSDIHIIRMCVRRVCVYVYKWVWIRVVYANVYVYSCLRVKHKGFVWLKTFLNFKHRHSIKIFCTA